MELYPEMQELLNRIEEGTTTELDALHLKGMLFKAVDQEKYLKKLLPAIKKLMLAVDIGTGHLHHASGGNCAICRQIIQLQYILREEK